MDNYGLIGSYPVNRPLTREEHRRHLKQKEPSCSKPWYQLSVIKMNSTYLECVDKFYGEKGILTALAIFGLVTMLGVLSIGLFYTISDWPKIAPSEKEKIFLIGPVAIIISLAVTALWGYTLKKESFQYNHYPMRFNRKTRKVHVWRQDGTVMTEDWDKLFFTTTPNKKNTWSVQGHRMAADGETVLETFCLPWSGELDDPNMFSQWEFVRLYMEEGPENLVDQVKWVLDIDEKRESFYHGFQRLQADFLIGVSFFAITIAPVNFLFAIGRWFANQTGKVPYWPKEIDAQCVIAPDDPYIRDMDHLAHQEENALPPSESPSAFTLADLQTQAGMERYILSTLSPEMSETEKHAILEAKRPDFDKIRAKFAREEAKKNRDPGKKHA